MRSGGAVQCTLSKRSNGTGTDDDDDDGELFQTILPRPSRSSTTTDPTSSTG